MHTSLNSARAYSKPRIDPRQLSHARTFCLNNEFALALRQRW